MSSVNHDIARYIGRVLDVDRGRTEYTTALPAVERALAVRLLTIGQALHAHATGRADDLVMDCEQFHMG